MRDALQALVDKGEARVTATAYLRTTAGQRGKIEAGDEILYPTEFDPPEAPQSVEGPVEEGAVLTTPANPTAFETRWTGLNIETEAVVGRGAKVLELNIAPEQVHYLGTKSYGQDESRVTQPVFFFSLKSTVS